MSVSCPGCLAAPGQRARPSDSIWGARPRIRLYKAMKRTPCDDRPSDVAEWIEVEGESDVERVVEGVHA